MTTGFVSKAAVALKAWMKTKDVSQAEFAVLVTQTILDAGHPNEKPVNQSTISSWTRGATPSGLAMVAMQKVTDGDVSVPDWLVAAETPSAPVVAALATGT